MLSLLAMAPSVSHALADDLESFQVGGGVQFSRDSNLYRRAADDPRGVVADNLTYMYGVLGWDKTFSRQRFYGSFNAGKVSFAKESALDYDAQDFRAGWRGSFPREIKSGLEWTRSVQLANFADTPLSTRRNVIERDNLAFDIDVPLIGHWHLVGNASGYTRRNSDELQRGANEDGHRVGGGVGYVTSYGNRLDVLARSTRTSFPDAGSFDQTYREQQGDLRIGWAFSGAGRLDGFVGYVKRRHEREELAFRDFSGPSFRLAHTWRVGGSVVLTTTAAREIGTPGDSAFEYAVSKWVRFAPVWEATAKIRVGGQLEWRDRQYFGSRAQAIGFDRTEQLTTASLSLTWLPTRWAELSLSYRGEQRDTERGTADFQQDFLDYTAHSGTASVQLSF